MTLFYDEWVITMLNLNCTPNMVNGYGQQDENLNYDDDNYEDDDTNNLHDNYLDENDDLDDDAPVFQMRVGARVG